MYVQMIITKIITKSRTKWLYLKQAFYTSKNGKKLTWYFVERKNNPRVVSVIVRSLKTQKYLLIEQFRVPVQSKVLEFPAGLVDAEETIEEAAIRELQEETGYKDVELIYTSPLTPKSAGLSNEVSSFVYCTIKDEIKMSGSTNMEESEDIVHFWMTPEEFKKYIKNNKDIYVANDVMSYMMQYMIS